MSDLRKAVLGRHPKRTGLSGASQDFDPVPWKEYFDSEQQVPTKNGTFHVYKLGTRGPVLFCLHGGGYSGLTWSLFAVEITQKIECQVIALDIRGHGNTNSIDDSDLSLQTLGRDAADVIHCLFENNAPPIVLIGHSMGGAIVVEAASLIPSTVGLCVIDVVEGTALDALSSMQSILRGRPTVFKSVQHAIQWCYKGGQTNNLDAAKVSMPGQIINLETKKLAADEITDPAFNMLNKSSIEIDNNYAKYVPADVIAEESEEDDSVASNGSNNPTGRPPLPSSVGADFKLPSSHPDSGLKYGWRIDLSKTEPFWTGWFKGLSHKFLEVQVPKVLLLANIHGLDTALTVGQMQGKFQLQVLPRTSHAIQEDQPESVSDILAGYLVKQKITAAKDNFNYTMPCC